MIISFVYFRTVLGVGELTAHVSSLTWRGVKAASDGVLLCALVLSLWTAKYAWLTKLLLRAGDVETNPGPPMDRPSSSTVNIYH